MVKRIKDETTDGQNDVENLFNQYVAICNKAIEQHKDEFPYKQIISVTEAIAGERSVDLAIYDDEPKGVFSLRFKNKKLKKGGYPVNVKKAWRVNLSYIKHVVNNPKEYIDHPERLDLDWLKSKFGL